MNLKRSLSYLIVLLAWIAVISKSYAAEAKLDWTALEDEAVTLLSRYIQVDTTNPPGDELKAAQFLKAILERDGIEARVIESAPGRANIYARLKGNGAKKAIVLMHHMDVVPAEAKQWKEPPFSGAIKDGVIWGRGAIDNKGGGVMGLMTLLALKRQNIQLKGDVIFLGTADEEAGGVLGAGFLLEKHPELFKDVSVVLNEGGGIRLGEDGRARLYSVGVAEKVPLWLKLTAPAAPVTRASPGDNQAVLKLIAALGSHRDLSEPDQSRRRRCRSFTPIARRRRRQTGASNTWICARRCRIRSSPPSFSKTAATMPACVIRFPSPASKVPIRST